MSSFFADDKGYEAICAFMRSFWQMDDDGSTVRSGSSPSGSETETAAVMYPPMRRLTLRSQRAFNAFQEQSLPVLSAFVRECTGKKGDVEEGPLQALLEKCWQAFSRKDRQFWETRASEHDPAPSPKKPQSKSQESSRKPQSKSQEFSKKPKSKTHEDRVEVKYATRSALAKTGANLRSTVDKDVAVPKQAAPIASSSRLPGPSHADETPSIPTHNAAPSFTSGTGASALAAARNDLSGPSMSLPGVPPQMARFYSRNPAPMSTITKAEDLLPSQVTPDNVTPSFNLRAVNTLRSAAMGERLKYEKGLLVHQFKQRAARLRAIELLSARYSQPSTGLSTLNSMAFPSTNNMSLPSSDAMGMNYPPFNNSMAGSQAVQPFGQNVPQFVSSNGFQMQSSNDNSWQSAIGNSMQMQGSYPSQMQSQASGSSSMQLPMNAMSNMVGNSMLPPMDQTFFGNNAMMSQDANSGASGSSMGSVNSLGMSLTNDNVNSLGMSFTNDNVNGMAQPTEPSMSSLLFDDQAYDQWVANGASGLDMPGNGANVGDNSAYMPPQF